MLRSSVRRGVLVVSCLGAVVVAPSLLAGSDVWTAKQMNTTGYEDWAEVYPNDINESGKVVGYATDGSAWRALVWSNPTSDPVALDPVSGYDDAWAADVNANGTVCGVSGIMWGPVGVDWRACTWDDKGNVTDRHPADWFASDMWSLNNAGEGAGEVVDQYGYFFACFWPRSGDAVVLDTPSDAYIVSWASSVNKDGLIAGNAWSWATFYSHACYWDGPDGALVDIHDEIEDAVGEDLLWTQAYEATDNGEIAGFCAPLDAPYSRRWAFTYTAQDGVTILDSDGEDAAFAWQSAGKYLIGCIGGDPGFGGSPEAAVWERGSTKGTTTWTLRRITSMAGYTMIAVGASQEGNIVGAAQDSDGMVVPWYAKRAGK